MKEIVVISGKGGTGKTSVAASLAVLGGRVVVADCDVDAADLHLILEPTIMQSGDFSGGKSAVIQSEACVGCGVCADACRFRAIALDGPGNDVIAKTYNVDELRCEGCGLCERLCPTGAIQRRYVEDPYFEYTIDESLCVGCGKCVKGCNAFGNGSLFLQVRHDRCTNCNDCSIARACPSGAFRRISADEPYILKGV